MTNLINHTVAYQITDGYYIGVVVDVVGEYALVHYNQLQDTNHRPTLLRRPEIRLTLISNLKLIRGL